MLAGIIEIEEEYRANERLNIFYCFTLFALSLLSICSNSNIIITLLSIVVTIVVAFYVRGEAFAPFIICAYQFTYWIPYIYITLILLVFYVISNVKKLRINRYTIWYVIVAMLSAISLSFEGASFDHYVRTALSQLAIVILITSNNSYSTANLCLKSFVRGFLLKSIVSLYIAIKYAGLSYIIENRFGYGTLQNFLPDNLLMQNENQYAFFAVLSIAFAYLLFIGGRHCDRSKLKFISYLVICTVLGLLTKSRTFVFALAIFFALFLLARRTTLIERIKTVVIYVIGIFVAIIILQYSMPTVLDGIINRFMYADISNGRIDIFSMINKSFFSGSMMGILFGYFSMSNYMTSLRIDASFHNVIQKGYVLHGIVGFIAVIVMLWLYLKDTIKHSKAAFDFLYLIPLTLTISAGMGSNPDLIVFFLCILAYQMNDRIEIERYGN